MNQEIGNLPLPLLLKHYLCSKVDFDALFEKLTKFKLLDLKNLSLYYSNLTVHELCLVVELFKQDLDIRYIQEDIEVGVMRILCDMYDADHINLCIDIDKAFSVEESKSKLVDPRKLKSIFDEAKSILKGVKNRVNFFLAKLAVWGRVIDYELSSNNPISYQELCLRVQLCATQSTLLTNIIESVKEIATMTLNPVTLDPMSEIAFKTLRNDMNSSLAKFGTNDLRDVTTMYNIDTSNTKFITMLIPRNKNVIAIDKYQSGVLTKCVTVHATDLGTPLVSFGEEELMTLLQEGFCNDDKLAPTKLVIDTTNVLNVCGIVGTSSLGLVYTDWRPKVEEGKLKMRFDITYPTSLTLDSDIYKNVYLWSRSNTSIKFVDYCEPPVKTGATFILLDNVLNTKDISNVVQFDKLELSLLFKRMDGTLSQIKGSIPVSLLTRNFANEFIRPSGIDRLSLPITWLTRSSMQSWSFVNVMLSTITNIPHKEVTTNMAALTMQTLYMIYKKLGCTMPSKDSYSIYLATMLGKTDKLEEIRKTIS